MNYLKLNQKTEKLFQIAIIVITYIMIILRFLLNEKGRVSPDSIRYMRQAKLFPIIDNTTAPLGYPLAIKFFTYINLDEFWSSKVVGLLAFSIILFFSYKKKFYFRELITTSALFSFVSIFSFTNSEAFILPFIILFFYFSQQAINRNSFSIGDLFKLSLVLILMLNIRYSALFFCFGTITFGGLNLKKAYSKTFILAGLVGIIFYALYKICFIDYFNKDYVNSFLETGLHTTPELLIELYQGLSTTFNPFIHIANPSGGIINIGIYGIGSLTILIGLVLIIKQKLDKSEQFIIVSSVTGIVCSFLIQYVYSLDALDYRLLAPFSIGIWMVVFRKFFNFFGNGLTYLVAIFSLVIGFVFTWLSKGNYLESRAQINKFLEQENLKTSTLKFYVKDELSNDGQTGELISTVNPLIYWTFNPKDTLKQTTLTRYKVEQKISIKKNKYQ